MPLRSRSRTINCKTRRLISSRVCRTVLPAASRTYADRQTQAAFDAWNGGAGYVATMVAESTLETEALREKIRALACSK